MTQFQPVGLFKVKEMVELCLYTYVPLLFCCIFYCIASYACSMYACMHVAGVGFLLSKRAREALLGYKPVSYTHLTLPTNREV